MDDYGESKTMGKRNLFALAFVCIALLVTLVVITVTRSRTNADEECVAAKGEMCPSPDALKALHEFNNLDVEIGQELHQSAIVELQKKIDLRRGIGDRIDEMHAKECPKCLLDRSRYRYQLPAESTPTPTPNATVPKK